ncbi:MAG: restriction endonuclease [Paracoccaceae bacterium]
MSAKSHSFELLVGRILSLSRENVTNLICDDRVIDPDGDGRTRQVDITYKRDDALVHVECRDHKNPQDVKWIEELIGRRASLRPDIMIGVSSSGFTELALKKANAYGIILRSVQAVTDQEIVSWGHGIVVTAHFVRFDCLNIVLTATSKLTDDHYSNFWQDIVSRRELGSWLSVTALQFRDLEIDQTFRFIAKVNTPSPFKMNPVLSTVFEIEIEGFVTCHIPAGSMAVS